MAILEDYDSYLEDLNELDDDEQQQQQQNSNNNCVYNVDESLTLSNFHVKGFKDITSKVENLFSLGLELTVDNDPDAQYRFTVASNNLLLEIDSQIFNLYNLIRNKYSKKFPELESVIQDPIEYARVVKKIGNETGITVIDGLNLVPAILMVVSITTSTTSGKPLSEQDLADTIHTCDYILALDSSKKRVLDLLEARMGYTAPNLSAIVGVTVAAKLIVAVGGLSSLAYTPSSNVALVGAVKKANIGFSNVKTCLLGYLEETEIYRSTRPSLKRCIGGVLPNKAVLAARMDLTKGDPTGKWGRDTLDTIRETIEKLQEPPPAARLAKPLPVPVLDYSSKKKKRGGQRQRNSRKRYGITETRKLANRVQSGVPEESYLGAGYGKGYGILGQVGLKVQRKLPARNWVC
nr:U4/U6 small nuclear ribonucleoprotein Prp31 homolog [Quercus suber]